MEIKPQKGKQEQFLSSSCDITIYGGAAGGGKTFSAILDPLRLEKSPFPINATIFRRTYSEITDPGGIWEKCDEIYTPLGYTKNGSRHYYKKNKLKIYFRGVQYKKDLERYRGSQIPVMFFEELTEFTKEMVFFLLSRNRNQGKSIVSPYFRATTNPEKNSWVRDWIAPWLDEKKDYPNEKMAGVPLFFQMINDKYYYGKTKEELEKNIKKDGLSVSKNAALTMAFIPARLEDNKELEKTDPLYRVRLNSLPRHEKERLLYGRWGVSVAKKDYFDRNNFTEVRPIDIPTPLIKIRFWDRAGSIVTKDNPNPDYTASVKIGFYVEDMRIIILDATRDRLLPSAVSDLITRTAKKDKHECIVGISQDPGQAGKFEISYYQQRLIGYTLYSFIERKTKEQRAAPLSGYSRNTSIHYKIAEWNSNFFDEIESFPLGKKDTVDAFVGAFNYLTEQGFVTDGFVTQDFTSKPMALKLEW